VEAEGNEILIPFVDAHISLFDEKKKILIVKDVEGLLN
jgi:ribosomal 30S subunit maturation factor RimM